MLTWDPLKVAEFGQTSIRSYVIIKWLHTPDMFGYN